MDTLNALSDRYRRFAEEECYDYSPLYASLGRAVAESEELLSFLAEVPDPQPNLFLASVQYLAGPSGMPSSGSALLRFVTDHEQDIGEIMRSRHTQTNEVGRCALLLPALPSGPLALVEVGASAGLCVLLDQFIYDYDGVHVGGHDSRVRLECQTLGEAPLPIPEKLPEVVWRRGLDIDPVSLDDPDDVAWLLACVWADHPERRKRLEAVISMASASPPEVMKGDLVDDLPALLAKAPENTNLVVFHTAVFPYLEPERRGLFRRALAVYSKQRKITLVSMEGIGMIPSLDDQAPDRGTKQFRIGRTVFAGGKLSDQDLLALGHPHGRDIEWLGATSGGRSPNASRLSSTFNIRPVQASDSERLFEIRQRAILELAVPAYSVQEATTWSSSQDMGWMEGIIRTNDLWVASSDDRVVGWIGLDEQRVIGLYTDPSYACRGIGSCLLAHAERHLLSSRVRVIELEASWNSEEWYLRRGYQPLANRPPDGPRPMRKELGS